MKTLIIIVTFLLGYTSYAQSYTEKYNTYLNRYEYFNSNNQLVGYKQYDRYAQAWKYYEEKPVQQYQPQSNINIPLTQQVMASKQARYNFNKNRIDEYISMCRNVLNGLDTTTAIREKIRSRLNNEVLSKIQGKPVDLSIDANADNIIKYLTTNFDRIVLEEL